VTDSYYYIPVQPESKRPVAEFGGWPVDPTEAFVVESVEVKDSKHDWWAVVGNKTSDLLVIDIDLYKMTDAEKASVEYGWYGLLDDTRIVKTPSGGLHVYLRTDAEFDNTSHVIDNVDLKGDVARGYALARPTNEYTVQNDVKPTKVSTELLRELPVFRSFGVKHTQGTIVNSGATDGIHAKTSPPCLANAVDVDTEFADKLVSGAKHGEVDEISVYRVLDKSRFPEGSNVSAPNFLHDSPSSTGSNFRVDEGGETFRCWRHSETGNAYHLIGVKAGIINCGDWAVGYTPMGEIKQYARNNGFVTDDDVISCETVQENDLCPFECGRRHPFSGVTLWR
jgi:hypothetical protein